MEKIIVVDFGSQYTQLIARKIRNLHVYCEVQSYKSYKIDEYVKGIILSGGPDSVVNNNLYKRITLLEKTSIPVLGLCYGSQLLVKEFGGKVDTQNNGEYGNTTINIIEYNKILDGIDDTFDAWMSHNDTIEKLPKNWKILAKTDNDKISIFNYENYYGILFHPEVSHTKCGNQIFSNFITICKCSMNWTEENFIKMSIDSIRKCVGDTKEVILALSGGVDSTVAAHLIYKAIGNRLIPVIVNNGFMRKNEYEEVLKYCKEFGMNVIGVDASEIFYNEIKGITDPEKKRKVVGKVFIDVFSNIVKEKENVKFLAQGTIYPDVIESVSGIGKIKSHHNVGGLPENMTLSLLEPLRLLFKDEVRQVGLCLGISEDIINRHPFPGPGLSIRILGEVTKEKVCILQNADNIFITKLKEYNIYDEIWQAGTILLPVKSVGVMGDIRTYENVIVLRAVESIDGMTADWYNFPKHFLSDVSNHIINNVNGVNRVVYDISSKPPATIEWE